MSNDHQQWLVEAAEHSRAKRYDQARELALRVLREDGTNTRALWLVATVTASLSERRNALNQLLRLQPDDLNARRMLDAINHEAKRETTAIRSVSGAERTAIRSIKPNAAPQLVLLYAVVASVLLVVVATAFVAIAF